jgi:hypothetical protein
MTVSASRCSRLSPGGVGRGSLFVGFIVISPDDRGRRAHPDSGSNGLMVSEFASVQIRKTQLGSPLTRGVHLGRKRDLAVALANPFCGASNRGGSGLGGQEPPRFFPGLRSLRDGNWLFSPRPSGEPPWRLGGLAGRSRSAGPAAGRGHMAADCLGTDPVGRRQRRSHEITNDSLSPTIPTAWNIDPGGELR